MSLEFSMEILPTRVDVFEILDIQTKSLSGKMSARQNCERLWPDEYWQLQIEHMSRGRKDQFRRQQSVKLQGPLMFLSGRNMVYCDQE